MTRSYSDLFRLPDSYMTYDLLRLSGESLDNPGCCKGGTSIQHGTIDFLKMIQILDKAAFNLRVDAVFTDRDWNLSCTQYNSDGAALKKIRFEDLAWTGIGGGSGDDSPPYGVKGRVNKSADGRPGSGYFCFLAMGGASVGLALHLVQLAAYHADQVLSGKLRNLDQKRVACEWITSQALLAFQALVANLRIASDALLDETSIDGSSCYTLLAKFCDQHLYFRISFQALMARAQQHQGGEQVVVPGGPGTGSGRAARDVSVIAVLVAQILRALVQKKAVLAKNSLTPLLRGATRFASAAAPQRHQEERQLQPHEVAERCRAAKGFPLVKDVSRTDGELLTNAVRHFTRELPEGEQLTRWRNYSRDGPTVRWGRVPKLVHREDGREYSLDEFQIIVPPEEGLEEEAECDGGEKGPEPHEEALAEVAAKTLREELWVLLGALDRRLHLLEKRQWFDFVGDPSLHVQDDSLGRVTGEETVAGLGRRDRQVFAAQFSALRALLGEQIALGCEDTATARLRQLRGIAVGVEALRKRIDSQEQLRQALEGLPRVVAPGTGSAAWSAPEVEAQAGVTSPPLLLTQKMGISIQNVSKFVQLFRAGDCYGLGAVHEPIAMPYLVDGDGERLDPIRDFRYVFPGKASNADVPALRQNWRDLATIATHEATLSELEKTFLRFLGDTLIWRLFLGCGVCLAGQGVIHLQQNFLGDVAKAVNVETQDLVRGEAEEQIREHLQPSSAVHLLFAALFFSQSLLHCLAVAFVNYVAAARGADIFTAPQPDYFSRLRVLCWLRACVVAGMGLAFGWRISLVLAQVATVGAGGGEDGAGNKNVISLPRGRNANGDTSAAVENDKRKLGAELVSDLGIGQLLQIGGIFLFLATYLAEPPGCYGEALQELEERRRDHDVGSAGGRPGLTEPLLL
eukprot:g15122.t1